jgi:hypothetical protein
MEGSNDGAEHTRAQDCAGEPPRHEQGEQPIYKQGLILAGLDTFPDNTKQRPGCHEMSIRPDSLHMAVEKAATLMTTHGPAIIHENQQRDLVYDVQRVFPSRVLIPE